MRGHFALHFLPQSLLPAGKGRGREGKRDDEKGKKGWEIANLHLFLCLLLLSLALELLLLHSLCAPPVSALIILPISLQKPTQAAFPAGPSRVCGGGPAVSNEITSVRFQTSTASLAFNNTSTKWWTGRGQSKEGKDGGVRRKAEKRWSMR